MAVAKLIKDGILSNQLIVINCIITSHSILLKQLPESQLSLFPAILTRMLGCDKAVISLLRSRTLGNSATALRSSIFEIHSEEWLRKQLRYYDDCIKYRSDWNQCINFIWCKCNLYIFTNRQEQADSEVLSQPPPVFAEPLPFAGLPTDR